MKKYILYSLILLLGIVSYSYSSDWNIISPWIKSGANVSLGVSTDNVGIGLTPSVKLDVNGIIKTNNSFNAATSGEAVYITGVQDQNSAVFIGQPNVANWRIRNTATTGTLSFSTAGSGTGLLNILTSGNVQIGSTVTGYKLIVGGGVAVGTAGGTDSNPLLYRDDSGEQFCSQYTNGGYVLQENCTGTIGFIIKDGGNVGINDVTPDGKLDIEPTGAVITSTYGINLSNLVTNTTTDGINKYGIYITSTGSFTGGAGAATTNWGLYVDTVSGADNNYGAYFNDNVGIGTTTFQAEDKLVVNGAIRLADGGAKPTCSVSYRFMIWTDEGGAGVKDTVEICAKDAGDLYAWRTIY